MSPSNRFARWVMLTLVVAASLRVACSAQSAPIHARDLNGHQIDTLTPPGTSAVVLIFAATDCPISRRYIPEIARIQREFSGRNVALWWVFPNPGDTVSVVKKHELDYSIHASTVVDEKQELVEMAHVSVTPEVAVFSVDHGALREAYHGRIDDLYYSFGRAKPAATRHDLEDAIKAVLAGRPATVADHGPVGCSIIPLAMVSQSK